MKISLFGAAFDPPHLGHLQIAKSLISKDIADQVWLLPVKYHEFGKNMSSDKHRLAMLELMVNKLRRQTVESDKTRPSSCRLRIETYELDLPGKSYTYQTLVELKKRHPQHRFSFVIGADNLQQFTQWQQYQKMIKEFPFYVYPRPGYSLEKLLPEMKLLRGVKQSAIASTTVRQALNQNQAISHLVLPSIEQYIMTHHLYQ